MLEAHTTPLAQQRVAAPARKGAAHFVALCGEQVGRRRERPGINDPRVQRTFAQAALAVKQRLAQLGFKRAHAVAQRRLDQETSLCQAAERARSGQRQACKPC